ncbi:SDR family NAD(P)-dependent oxidoreductase [bacterium]|nr:SDR family NAD(P)-dependent oxidoreductase [bacterium]
MIGKNAIIYGATGGLGHSLCQEFINRGVNVFLIARSGTKLRELAAEFKLKPFQIFNTKTITTDQDYLKTLNWLKTRKKVFSYAVHAAGQGLMKNAFTLSLNDWTEIIDINLTSSFAFFKLIWEVREKNDMELVYFSSASLSKAWPKNGLYGASKAGLEAFAQSLHQDIKSQGGRVWLYRLGSVDTPFFDNVPNHVPREKMLSPREIAKIVVTNVSMPKNTYFPVIPIVSD